MNFLKVLGFVFYVETPGPLQVACWVGSGRTAPVYFADRAVCPSCADLPGYAGESFSVGPSFCSLRPACLSHTNCTPSRRLKLSSKYVMMAAWKFSSSESDISGQHLLVVCFHSVWGLLGCQYEE